MWRCRLDGPPTIDLAGARTGSSVYTSGPAPVSQDEVADAELVRLIAAQDRTALAVLYERHGQAVLAQTFLVVGERTLAEEILQDTMLAAWRGAASFRGEASVRSWLIAIARRKSRDRMRRRQLYTAAEDILAGWPSAEPGPEDLTLDRAEAAAVAESIGELDIRHREILGLLYGAGLSLADAATVLAIPLGTVKSRLAAARSVLSKSLREKGYAR